MCSLLEMLSGSRLKLYSYEGVVISVVQCSLVHENLFRVWENFTPELSKLVRGIHK